MTINSADHDSRQLQGVTEQLRYGGVLQVVQVSRAGYPVRINHQDGTTDFPRCGHGSGDRVQECWDDYKVIGASKVVNELRHGQSWAVGKTLVFFKLPAYERIKFARRVPRCAFDLLGSRWELEAAAASRSCPHESCHMSISAGFAVSFRI
ncbi:Unconventional myosin-X [Durusdinium trenchii]|uniref:Unconventional myosin-X n=1 Tax=Durusdinium trenchii TaxID=1381693 RepID=A0ABP0LGV5_9DINO